MKNRYFAALNLNLNVMNYRIVFYSPMLGYYHTIRLPYVSYDVVSAYADVLADETCVSVTACQVYYGKKLVGMYSFGTNDSLEYCFDTETVNQIYKTLHL